MRRIRGLLGGTVTAFTILAGPALAGDLSTGSNFRFEFSHLAGNAGTARTAADDTTAPAGAEGAPVDSGMPSDAGTPGDGATPSDGAMPGEGMPSEGAVPGDGETPASTDGAKTASSVQDTDVYHHNDGKSQKFCTMYVGDKGEFVEAKADQPDWVFLKGISGDCKGKDGWVWNGGSLKID